MHFLQIATLVALLASSSVVAVPHRADTIRRDSISQSERSLKTSDRLGRRHADIDERARLRARDNALENLFRGIGEELHFLTHIGDFQEGLQI
jgi:hypothetical protein